jgi:hypothetical protein
MGSAPSPTVVLTNLVERGWIPLRQVAILLGMKELRGIYARQKGRNAIPTIRIGGTERVYADDVLHVLRTAKPEKCPEAGTLISMYKTALRAHEREQGD